MLSRRLNNIASDGSLSNLKYTYVADKVLEIEAKLDEMTLEEEQTGNVNKQTSSERPPNNSVPQPHPEGMVISYKSLMLLHLKVVQRVLKGREHLWKSCFRKMKSLAGTVDPVDTTLLLVLCYTYPNLIFRRNLPRQEVKLV
jgi:hypothetical protein